MLLQNLADREVPHRDDVEKERIHDWDLTSHMFKCA